ncbi:MAG: ATP-binding protein [candidate division KSB1 bacterium]|nr:ATP-binding protein [candidate division KSB1 bacterium]
MIIRPFWIAKIQQALTRRSIVWLSGVRRVGKTTLIKMFKDAHYLNCDLPSVARQFRDTEYYYDHVDKKFIIFDEIHRLEDPSLLLKIAADEYPHLKIIATGSSTLAATQKFRDSLTGRKVDIYLPPVLWQESVSEFQVKDFDHRLLHGGLPEALLDKNIDLSFYSEWMDSFYARDVQEMFNIRNRTGFIKLLQFIFLQSGGLLEYTSLAKHSELTRPTVKSYIDTLTIAHAIFLLRPFYGGGRREIIRRPKCYAFDTGFVAFVRGWNNLRAGDRGGLWEHLVLDTLRSYDRGRGIYYWRDKSNREIDFVLPQSNRIHAIECKINPDHVDINSFSRFRLLYPEGNNYVVSPAVKESYLHSYSNHRIQFINIEQLGKEFKEPHLSL